MHACARSARADLLPEAIPAPEQMCRLKALQMVSIPLKQAGDHLWGPRNTT